MNRSESIGKLADALSKAQRAMSSAKKDAANPFFKSTYADLASVIEAIKIPLADNSLAYVQTVGRDADAVTVTVETVLMHVSGEWVASIVAMKPVKADPQGIGSVITYARRYGLQALVGVPSEDDDGNAASQPQHSNGTPAKPVVKPAPRPSAPQQEALPQSEDYPPAEAAPPAPPALATREQVDRLRALIELKGIQQPTVDRWYAKAGVRGLANLPGKIIDSCIAWAEKQPEPYPA